MSRKSVFSAVLYSAFLAVLIFDSKSAVYEAGNAIDLCLKSLIPSLLPFIFVSMLLTPELSDLPIPILRFAGRICGLPEGAESILLIGFMGGYPVGAQQIGAAFCNGNLSKKNAERMLAFCCNAGPAFFFGVISPMFSNPGFVWLLWGIHIFTALWIGVLLCEKPEKEIKIKFKHISPPEALASACRAVVKICGWVILFRIVLSFFQRWGLWILPDPVQIAAVGIVELSNGCIQLMKIQQEGSRFVVASIIMGFGGLCVLMQTASVIYGLSLRPYFLGKTLHAILSFVTADAVQKYLFPAENPIIPLWIDVILFASVSVAVKFPFHRKNRYSIPSFVRV